MLAKLSSLTLIAVLLAWGTCPRVAAAAGEAAQPANADAHAAGGHGEHIGLGNAGLGLEKPEEIRSDLAFFTLVVFLCLLLILWKFAWGPIIAALERREQAVADHIAQAQRNHEESKALLAQYEQKLAAAAGEVRALMDEARRTAEHARQAILAEAKTAADAERVRALHEIEVATDQALKSLAERSAQLAVDLAGKILQTRLNKDDHARLIQEAVAKFPASTSSVN